MRRIMAGGDLSDSIELALSPTARRPSPSEAVWDLDYLHTRQESGSELPQRLRGICSRGSDRSAQVVAFDHGVNATFTLPKRFAWPEAVSTTVTRSQLASMEVTVSVPAVDQVPPRSEENCGV